MVTIVHCLIGDSPTAEFAGYCLAQSARRDHGVTVRSHGSDISYSSSHNLGSTILQSRQDLSNGSTIWDSLAGNRYFIGSVKPLEVAPIGC